MWAATVAALLLVIGAAAYGIVFLGKSKAPEKVAVPSLIGQTLQAANTALVKAGFQPDSNPGTTPGPCTDGVGPNVAPKPDKVCTQNPPAGSMQTKDTRVT